MEHLHITFFILPNINKNNNLAFVKITANILNLLKTEVKDTTKTNKQKITTFLKIINSLPYI